MAKYRYVGGAEGGFFGTPYQFTRYGQLVELPDGWDFDRLSLITPEEFDSLGHPPEEVRKYADFKSHASASQEFLMRRSKAWDIVHSNYDKRSRPAPKEA